MMKGDFTRQTFRSRNHFRSVLLQQGRVQLDADWNEQLDIQAYLDETTTRDTVGWHGGPIHDAGMTISCAGGDIHAGCAGADLQISAGRYYVGGIVCENEDPVPLGDQPDLPGVGLPADDGRYVAYLDVWHEHVTAVERPALREVALGGPDTATRRRTIWQLRLEPVGANTNCTDVAPPWAPAGSASTGRLRARAQAPTVSPDPCVIPATAGYRRLENQLYRVEIHDDSDAGSGPTYVWSRENGSVVARLAGIADDVITIDVPGRDERLGFAKDDWVEVIDVDRVRRGEHGLLGRLDDAVGTELTVAEWRDGATPTMADLGDAPVVRRWDSDGAVPVVEDSWVDLEDGVQVQFEVGGVYRTGDYWLVPARTANLQGVQLDPDLAGDVDWPREAGVPIFQPRVGVEHRFAAVALLDLAGGQWTLVSDCRRLFPPLTELTDVEYAGGDGQEAMPTDPLPQPLEISVSNGIAPIPGASVRFTAADSDGRLATAAAGLAGSAVSTVEAVTDADGLARCFWRPAADVSRPSQRVTARLLDRPGGTPLGAPVDFAASLSIADQVWFDPSTCVALDGVRTVQDAVDRLVAARSLAQVGGDGQDGRPGNDLPLPAVVLVRTDCGPVAGATVRFAVPSGAVAEAPGGLGDGATTVDITTGADGLAACFWRLGPAEPVQVLTAELIRDSAPVEEPLRLAFTANLRGERDRRPGLHVTDVIVLIGNRPLHNDSSVTPDDLAEGIAVLLDGWPLDVMIEGKPVLALTLDMPFPFSSFDQELWGSEVFGTQPLMLAGRVRVQEIGGDPGVTWEPTRAIREFMEERLFPLMEELERGDRVLCHLTLTGRAVADSRERDRRVVNGLALGMPRADGGTDMELPTVDDVLGADFTLWFWLVARLNRVVIVPTRSGLLRMASMRNAVTLALPRAETQARLPAGALVTPGEPDLDNARRAADRAFRDQPERRLVFIVDERYVDAAALVRDALGQLDVELELVAAADPVAAARVRMEAGEDLDGVLTTDDVMGGVSGLGGFAEAVSL